jgi:hypothetical protein
LEFGYGQEGLKILWTVVFFTLGFVLFATFIGAVLPWAFHEERAVFERKVIFAALIAPFCFIGLPNLALILCRRGVLPGTRRFQRNMISAPNATARRRNL